MLEKILNKVPSILYGAIGILALGISIYEYYYGTLPKSTHWLLTAWFAFWVEKNTKQE